MGDDSLRIALTTLDDAAAAAALARTLVEERLAACVNVVAGAQSIYRWKGGLETAHEHLLLIKTTAAAWPRCEQRLRELHPYELPEIVVLATAGADAAYARWIAESVDAAAPVRLVRRSRGACEARAQGVPCAGCVRRSSTGCS